VGTNRYPRLIRSMRLIDCYTGRKNEWNFFHWRRSDESNKYIQNSLGLRYTCTFCNKEKLFFKFYHDSRKLSRYHDPNIITHDYWRLVLRRTEIWTKSIYRLVKFRQTKLLSIRWFRVLLIRLS
jgi:hypothetical protein